MNTNIIEEACANIASISQRMEQHCKSALHILDRMNIIELDPYQEEGLGDEYGAHLDALEAQEEHNCGNCMSCLGLSWREFI